MYAVPRSVSDGESLRGFGVVELEPGDKIGCHPCVEFVCGKRIEYVNAEHG